MLGQTRFGFAKTGSYRAQFLLESISDLRNKLRSLGSDLVIRRGLPELVIPELATEIQATDIYFHGETTSEEIKVEANLIHNLDKLGISSKSFWGHTLYHPEDLPFSISSLPELFTSFRKEVEKSCTVNPPFPVPSKIPAITDLELGEIPTLTELGLEPAIADPIL